MGSFLLTCVTTGVALSTVWCLSGATPRGQPWTLVMTLPQGHDGLSVRLMVVLWLFRTPSIDRSAHRQFPRNGWLDLLTILSVTACHQRNYVEAYSKSTGKPLLLSGKNLDVYLRETLAIVKDVDVPIALFGRTCR